MDAKDREKMLERFSKSRKDRVFKVLEKIRSGEYATEGKADAKEYKEEAFESLDEEGKEKLAEKEKKRREREHYGD